MYQTVLDLIISIVSSLIATAIVMVINKLFGHEENRQD